MLIPPSRSRRPLLRLAGLARGARHRRAAAMGGKPAGSIGERRPSTLCPAVHCQGVRSPTGARVSTNLLACASSDSLRQGDDCKARTEMMSVRAPCRRSSTLSCVMQRHPVQQRHNCQDKTRCDLNVS